MVLNTGPAELIVIVIVLLIAVGPEQLPGVIRKVGRFVSQARSMTDGLRSEFMAGLDEIERSADPRRWQPDHDDPLPVNHSANPAIRTGLNGDHSDEPEPDSNAQSEDTAPGAENTAPGAEDTAPGAEDTAPGAEDTAPGAEDTAPGAEESAAPSSGQPRDEPSAEEEAQR